MNTLRACTRIARLRGRAAAATLPGVAALLLLGFAGSGGAWAAPAGDDDSPAGGSARRVFPSGIQADTLAATWREVFPIALSHLKHDDWKIARADTTARQVVTQWKTMDHVLTRIALGDIQARCVVDLEPLADGRTIVRMRGGLASAEDLEAKPAWGAALTAYRKAARKYLSGVRGDVERASATAAAPVERPVAD